MKRFECLVQGSAVEPYKVVFERNGSNLNAFCTCPAGSNGQYCKHRFRILSGNPEGIVSGDLALLPAVVDWLVGTDVEYAIRELSRAEDALSSAKKALKDAKISLAIALRK